MICEYGEVKKFHNPANWNRIERVTLSTLAGCSNKLQELKVYGEISLSHTCGKMIFLHPYLIC